MRDEVNKINAMQPSEGFAKHYSAPFIYLARAIYYAFYVAHLIKDRSFIVEEFCDCNADNAHWLAGEAAHKLMPAFVIPVAKHLCKPCTTKLHGRVFT